MTQRYRPCASCTPALRTEAGELSVVAGGRAVVRLPNPPAIEKPEGFAPLIETRVTTLVGTVAARRMAVGSGADGVPTR